MTVKELVNELLNFGPDEEIVFTYNSRDYWNTVVASEIDKVEEGWVTYSKYHEKFQVSDPDKIDEGRGKWVIMLS